MSCTSSDRLVRTFVTLIFLSCGIAFTSTAAAINVAFTVDSSASNVTYDSSIEFFGSPIDAVAPDTANLSGTIAGDVDIALSGVISGLSFSGGDATADTTLTQEFDLGPLLGDAGFDIVDLSLGFSTPGGPNPAVVGGNFDLGDQNVALDDAVILPATGLLAVLPTPLDFPEDGATTALLPVADFSGTGMITATPQGGSDFLLTLTIPLSQSMTVDGSAEAGLNPGEFIVTSEVTGTVVAMAFVTVPEPSSGLLMIAAGATLVVWHRASGRRSGRSR